MHKTMRKSAVLKGAVAGIASIAMLMSVSVTANAADTPSYGSAVKPNITSLLGEYYNWWTPKKVVNNTPQGDAFRGKVTDAGKSVLGQNDKTVVAINNKAAADTTKVDGTYTQAERAALDASDGDALRIYKDAFGPIIGQYVAEGVAQGELPKTSDLVFSKSSKDSFAGFVGTGSAKKDFNYPRPYFNKENEGVDRTIGGDTDLNGLSSTLDIKRIPMINIDGQEYGEDYTDYQEPSQSFPSGHTTKTYNRGLGLATLLPELGPELVARAAEGGNNRIVLGVHYPLDIMGGHIAGQYGVATAVSDEKTAQEGAAARAELVDYLTAQCKADNHGDTLDVCITNTGANAANGYRNDFTDEVSTKPVTDRASALAAYKARMTYGFQATGTTGQAPVVPDSAVRMFDNVAAFKSLDSAQKKAVLAATEGDSGYPLDASSQGWARVNLAAAYSAKVTLSADGKNVVKVEPGQAQASVVRETSGNNGGNGNGGSNAGNTGVNNASGRNPSGTQPLSKTGADVSGIASAFILIAAAGVTIMMIRRKHAI
ncbi:phosphatase PAP2 family protein [Bifidobacterium bifidum]|uniref:phosphatase PAP2 family protein n=1 Tax=Bifidobacterium bifidum TaxID=1681 RepID=UPI00232DBF27|nr:phosphatase PAP2 family protein [Bifidobacterium bifidum]MDB1202413.1 phosphatase PAP2 family protein [Bifidobacterium bifidum]